MFGTAPPEHYSSSFNEKMLTSGFFGRMTIIDMEGGPGKGQDAGDLSELPEPLLEAAEFWYNKSLSLRNANLLWEHPKPVVVPFANDDVELFLKAFREKADDIRNNSKDQIERATWGRVAEMARKLALLYACSESYLNPRITQRAAEWGVKMVEHIIRRQLYKVSVYYAENDFHKLLQKAERYIRQKAVNGKVERTEVAQGLRIKARDMNDLEDTLEDQGFIEIDAIRRPNSKRVTKVYALVN